MYYFMYYYIYIWPKLRRYYFSCLEWMPAKFQPDRIIGSRDMGVRDVAPDYGTQIPQRIRCTMLCNHDKKKYHLPSLDLWCRHFFHKLKTTPTIFFIFLHKYNKICSRRARLSFSPGEGIVISYGIRKPTLSVPETKSRSSKIRNLVEGTERGFQSP